MKKAFAWLILLTVTALFAMSVTPALAHTETDPAKQWLLAGSPHYYGEPGPHSGTDWYWEHRMRVGTVFIWNDGDYLYVKYYTNTTAGWYLTETHLAVVTDPEDFPMTKKGNPKVGHFPYKHEGLTPTYEYMIPLEADWEPEDMLYIAAHAVVEKRSDGCVLQEETAWANCGGSEAYFRGNNWATYFWYEVQ